MKKQKYENVVPTPTGNKLFVTANMFEKPDSIIILPNPTLDFLDIQTVIKPGEYILNANGKGDYPFKIEEGDVILLDTTHRCFKKVIRKKTEAERLTQEGMYDTTMESITEFNVDIYTFNNVDYALIDKEAIIWIWKKGDLE